jgi:hypothetical protein
MTTERVPDSRGMTLERAPDNVTIFRVAHETFLPPGGSLSGAFEPNAGDVKEATSRKLPGPLLSVWDDARTTLVQARSLIRSPGKAFKLDVGAIRAIKVEGAPSPEVYRDPLPAPSPEVEAPPWYAGHCGIFGLRALDEQEQKLRKKAFRALRVELAAQCAPVDE